MNTQTRALLLSDVMVPARRPAAKTHFHKEIILRELMMGPRSTEQLIKSVWPNPDDEPEYAVGSIGINIMLMRRRLKKGWKITCKYNFGYSLVGEAE